MTLRTQWLTTEMCTNERFIYLLALTKAQNQNDKRKREVRIEKIGIFKVVKKTRAKTLNLN